MRELTEDAKMKIMGGITTLLLALVVGGIFWFTWNKLASIYFYFLPEVFHTIPYLHIIGLMIIINVLGGLVSKVIK